VRRDRPSLTASLVASVRALYTALPAPYNLAPDPVAAELLPPILTLPARVAGLSDKAAPALHRALRTISLGLTQHVALRTRAIDDALRDAVGHGAAQLVVLGAGLDSRAERLTELAGARVFEVDHPSTHRFKAERLLRAGARLRAREIARVAIDFERDTLHDVLLAAGFDPAVRSFWIWEGVTAYLTPEATFATLRAVADLSAPGSRLAVTYVRPGGRPAPWFDPLTRALGALVGEQVRGMMERETFLGALADAGFVTLSDEGAADWAPRYWPGEEPVGEWERLAVAERRAAGEAAAGSIRA
jgi:methyltransferase (TIGR00027 family)